MTQTTSTPNHLLDRLVAQALAREAGQFAQQQRQHGFEIHLKARNDIVTSIDVAVEQLLKSKLSIAFPDDELLGEESGGSSGVGKRRWVIDPIDGTLNFSTGVPFYCVSVALQIDGVSVAAAVYDPSRDELFYASKGDGAFLNGKQLSVSTTSVFDQAVLVTGFPPVKNIKFNNLDNFVKLCRECRAVRRLGSAALDLCYVAAGRIDGFWEFGLKPWDTAAGYLILQEAGGKVTTYNNETYTGHQRSLIASNSHIHADLLASLTFDD